MRSRPRSARAPSSTLTRFSTLAVADVAARGLAFLATLLIVRAFADEAFGQLGVATAVVAYALQASTCGLDVFAVRHGARHPDQIGATASSVMAMRSTLGLVAYALLLAVCWGVPALRPIFPLVALFGLTIFTGALSLTWVPQALQQSGALAAANLSIGALYFLGVLVITRTGGPLWSVPVAQVAAEALVAVGLYWWLRGRAARLVAPRPWAEWGRVLQESAPIGASLLLRTIALGSDLVLLRLLLVGDAQIGWYNGASRLFALMMGLSAVYFTILFPRLSQRAAESPGAFRSEALGSLARVMPLALAAAVGVAALAPWALGLLFSPSFANAAMALRILGVAALVNVINNHFRYMLLATNRQQRYLRDTAVATLAHVAFKLVLIPMAGIEGAALGTLSGELAVLVLGLWATRGDLRRRVVPE
ncbi:oligosaccharide flippase family protein [Gemmatimonas sp.]|uniref:oligosaccharide flippase family protein n=1 Tax=Gemmatimonas sp. TaxID=1962908 RepID=UPI003983945E